MKKCLTCTRCGEREGKNGSVYYTCSEQGMISPYSLLPEECEKYIEKKEKNDDDINI